MPNAKRIGSTMGAAVLAATCCMQARAAEAEAGAARAPAPATMAAATADAAQAPRPAAGDPLGLPPVDARTLAARRGGTDVYNDMQLKGVVAENQAINVATGQNAITGGAFANASGVPMVVQNSGNNVLIQNATIINLQMR